MSLLALDIGSSAVKAAILHGGRLQSDIARAGFPTRFTGVRAEVDPRHILRALAAAIAQLGDAVKRIDVIAAAAMAPSWLAMDKTGRPLTPVITHQDRRSLEIAREIESRVGLKRLLRLSGNRAIPGGISSTTLAWFLKHEPALMRRADLTGHLSTFLLRHLTGGRVTDPSNASFMGLYATLDQSGWNDELCDGIGAPRHLLPDILPANAIAGSITRSAATSLGLTAGTPMLAGMMDTGAAMLLAGAKPGQLLNVSGSTDVLALCTDQPRPHEKLLTRALGVGKLWLAVSTNAAAGSSLTWAKEQLFADYTIPQFHRLLRHLARRHAAIRNPQSAIAFLPYLAGDRTSLDQPQAAFTGLTLATTREDMLAAILESLAESSAARLPLLQAVCPIRRGVAISGGLQAGLQKLLYRDWPGRWTFRRLSEATLRGLAVLAPKDRP